MGLADEYPFAGEPRTNYCVVTRRSLQEAAVEPPIRWWWLVLALTPFFVAVSFSLQHPPALQDGDYAQYLLHAQALAEGRPYSDIGYIFTERNLVGPRNQPPGWPLVLTPFVAAFGVNSPIIRVLVVALVAGFAVVAGRYFARTVNPATGIVVTAFVPLALETQRATGSALSDPLFCLAIWLCIWLIDTAGTWKRHAFGVFLGGAAVSVRVAGVAIVPALALHSLLRRRSSITSVLPTAILVAVVAVAALLARDQIPFLERFTIPHIPSQLRAVINAYQDAVTTATLYPFPSNLANDVYHAVLLVPLVVGAAQYLLRGAGSMAWCFLLMYSLLLFLSPLREARYAWPLLPFLVMWTVTGIVRLAAMVRSAWVLPQAMRIGLVTAGLIAVASAFQLSQRPALRSLYDDPDAQQLFQWVRDEQKALGDSLRVAFTNPRVLTLHTGVPAMGLMIGEDDVVLGEFRERRISHVVVPRAQFTREAERRLAEIVDALPSRFPEVYRNPSYDVRRFVVSPVSRESPGLVAEPLR